jgi:hypothetical protein
MLTAACAPRMWALEKISPNELLPSLSQEIKAIHGARRDSCMWSGQSSRGANMDEAHRRTQDWSRSKRLLLIVKE